LKKIEESRNKDTLRKTNDKHINKRLIFKTIILVVLFLSLNIIWFIFFHHDPLISLNLGIICPILYGVFYLIVKKTRRKLRSKIKPFIYIPIMYTLFGITWLVFSLGITKITHRSENIQADETVIEKLEFKNFFLFNYNLSYLSRVQYTIENKTWKESSIRSSTIMKSKYQTNNMILFLILFIIQGLFIYLTENVIYPYFRPEHKHKSKRKSRRKAPPRDTFISKEHEVFLNFGDTSNNRETKQNFKESNSSSKFPEL